MHRTLKRRFRGAGIRWKPDGRLETCFRQRERSHEIRVIRWLDSLRADVIFGWRQLKRNRVTSAAAVLSLALAVGACTTAFRLIDALLWRPLPVTHPERLYVLSRKGMGFDNKPGEWDSWAYPDFQLMRAAAKGKAELIAVSYADRADVTYKTDQEMEKAIVQHVSGWMFPSFGIQPAAGRLFTENDDRTPGAAPYAVLSYDYWSRRFGRDPNVVGQTFHYGDGVYQIIGVSERKFTGTEPGIVVDIFIPTMMHRAVTRQDSTWFRTLAIVEPGNPIEPLRAMFAAINHAFEKNRLSGETGLSQETLQNVLKNAVLLKPAPTGASGMQSEYARALGAIAVLVLMVLLIACANVANLMAAKAAAQVARDGTPRLDRRRALAAGAPGVGGEHFAGSSCVGGRSAIQLVVRASCHRHDQSQGQSCAPDSAGRLEGSGIRHRTHRRGSSSLRSPARVTSVLGRAGKRIERR